ncbi:hemerythrin domain-containing protein [Oleiagrimonas sp. C23AA]|uniref:hemerythrin domain-containing protein n=1 Tax=Oleiagrimonas sp. C23AA TaxID=2719047 RepID=UPI00198121FC
MTVKVGGELFDRTRRALRAHAVAEEMNFYRPLMGHEMTVEKSRHSVSEHKEIDDLIEQLEATDPSSSGWLATAQKLQHLVTHHLDEEEHEVFQVAGKALSDNDKHQLATSYRQEMERQLDAMA